MSCTDYRKVSRESRSGLERSGGKDRVRFIGQNLAEDRHAAMVTNVGGRGRLLDDPIKHSISECTQAKGRRGTHSTFSEELTVFACSAPKTRNLWNSSAVKKRPTAPVCMEHIITIEHRIRVTLEE